MTRRFGLAALFLSLVGCQASAQVGTADDELTVDTSTPEARAQYDANVAFARAYAPRCADIAPSKRPRVLVTGFGRFGVIANNATGRIISTMVPGVPYPETVPAPIGEIDQPAPQVSVGTAILDLPEVGEVDVCAMILPVSWDLAAILIAKEIAASNPSFVLMNGVAEGRQPLWLELGATNQAYVNGDGSGVLQPAPREGEDTAELVAGAAPDELAQPNLLSWSAVRGTALEATAAHADEVDADVRFGDVVQGAVFGGFPRSWNTYLCNNVTYVTGWLMNHPGREIHLLRASAPVPQGPSFVSVKMAASFASVPRAFVHWPSELADVHHAAAADVMKAIIAAQLRASVGGDEPTLGDTTLADPSLAADPAATE